MVTIKFLKLLTPVIICQLVLGPKF